MCWIIGECEPDDQPSQVLKIVTAKKKKMLKMLITKNVLATKIDSLSFYHSDIIKTSK